MNLGQIICLIVFTVILEWDRNFYDNEFESDGLSIIKNRLDIEILERIK